MEAVEEKGAELVGLEKGKELVGLKPRARCSEDEEICFNIYQAYPKALASREDVLANKNLFMESLEKLHRDMRSKFMIPTIGGKELDLHQLFVEVTSRGGIEKVIEDRRWREITNVFNFPATATNASFILRKHYMSLLRHYEKIYFFGAKGWNNTPAVSSSALSNAESEPVSKTNPALSFSGIQPDTHKRRKGPSLLANPTVFGVIDGCFDHGYFVTVVVGTTKLKGVLFNVSARNAAQKHPLFSGITDNSGAMVSRRRRRRRKRLSSMDPMHPKPNRSGYNFFFAEQHARLKLLYPGKDREISKMIGDLWNKLTEAEKSVYQERALKDKKRYQSEMILYRERLRTGPVMGSLMPIQQHPSEPSTARQNVDFKGTDDDDTHSEDGVGTNINELEHQHSGDERIAALQSGSATVNSLGERHTFDLWRDDAGMKDDAGMANESNVSMSIEGIGSKQPAGESMEKQ